MDIQEMRNEKRATDKAKRNAQNGQVQSKINDKISFVDMADIPVAGTTVSKFIGKSKNDILMMDKRNLASEKKVDSKIESTMDTFTEAMGIMKSYVESTNKLQSDFDNKERLETERKQKLEANILGYVREGA
jgi:hypothetical protein